MTADQQLLLIRNYDLWSHLTDEEFAELNLVHNYILAPKGDYVYFEAYNHNKLYFIKEGHIRIGYIDDKGTETIKEIIQKGEIFGQFTLEKNNLNGEFAQAYKTDVSLCAFTIEDFQKLLQKKPRLALEYSKQVGQKLRRVENRLVNLLNRDVKTRLINFFLMLAASDTEVEVMGDSVTLLNFLTHDDIARLIGSSRQTVTGFINQLEAEGYLFVNRRRIRIPAVKELQKLLTVT